MSCGLNMYLSFIFNHWSLGQDGLEAALYFLRHEATNFAPFMACVQHHEFPAVNTIEAYFLIFFIGRRVAASFSFRSRTLYFAMCVC